MMAVTLAGNVTLPFEQLGVPAICVLYTSALAGRPGPAADDKDAL